MSRTGATNSTQIKFQPDLQIYKPQNLTPEIHGSRSVSRTPPGTTSSSSQLQIHPTQRGDQIDLSTGGTFARFAEFAYLPTVSTDHTIQLCKQELGQIPPHQHTNTHSPDLLGILRLLTEKEFDLYRCCSKFSWLTTLLHLHVSIIRSQCATTDFQPQSTYCYSSGIIGSSFIHGLVSEALAKSIIGSLGNRERQQCIYRPARILPYVQKDGTSSSLDKYNEPPSERMNHCTLFKVGESRHRSL
ncbi:hypothetical protein HYFRA_00003903 [Hymenoscyphus fraxineus]|uniref:Uncharacterized protein n=1 Tax=Hymenoscyphus fraxineus TaxID=746836 RepID=A0A9N9KYU2_9HELO|nr:hypothetical protein HYFRA_00003903 [Hymenoscyphus fraxineus]